MRKSLLFFAFFLIAYSTFGQLPGLIAHWDMNGTTNDVSGSGLNGHGTDLTPAAGKDGVMGHAWYFNGTTSAITFPYSSSLNVTNYSIVATIKIQGFYSGPCHGNTIFGRGGTSPSDPGRYFFEFTDYPAGYGCTPDMDSSRESFVSSATSNSEELLPSSAFTLFDATPHIEKNEWYKVAITFNDTTYKVFVNNEVVAFATISSPGEAIGSSTDSGSIGINIYDAPSGFPYNFTGIIDDIQLYNRALTVSEIGTLSTTGVSNTILHNEISVSPNPAKNNVVVIAPFNIEKINVVNLLGQVVFTEYGNSKKINLDVSRLTAGVYILKVNDSYNQKIIKE